MGMERRGEAVVRMERPAIGSNCGHGRCGDDDPRRMVATDGEGSAGDVARWRGIGGTVPFALPPSLSLVSPLSLSA